MEPRGSAPWRSQLRGGEAASAYSVLCVSVEGTRATAPKVRRHGARVGVTLPPGPPARSQVAQIDLSRKLTEAIWHMLNRNQPFAAAGAGFRLAA